MSVMTLCRVVVSGDERLLKVSELLVDDGHVLCGAANSSRGSGVAAQERVHVR